MKNNIQLNQQIELPLAHPTVRPMHPRRRHIARSPRAAWWFDQMRQTVDRAATQPATLNPQPATV